MGYIQEVEDAGEIDIRPFWYVYNKMKRKIKKESKANYTQRRVQSDQCYFTVQITGSNFECSL